MKCKRVFLKKLDLEEENTVAGTYKPYAKGNKVYRLGKIKRGRGIFTSVSKALGEPLAKFFLGILKTRQKNSYVMGKLDMTKRVTLPSGRTFLARYKRVSRSQLLVNVVLKRTYR